MKSESKIHCYGKDGYVVCGRFKSAVFSDTPYVFDRLLPEYKCKRCEKKRLTERKNR